MKRDILQVNFIGMDVADVQIIEALLNVITNSAQRIVGLARE